MEWWGTRSKKDKTAPAPASASASASAPDEPWLAERATIKTRLLHQCHGQWGRALVHLFDRGFAGAPWIGELHEVGARWVMRWPKAYKLVDGGGEERAAWQHLRGKRSWDHQMMPDARRGCWSKRGVIATRVFHPAYGGAQEPLWLVASGPGGGREPWYLLTNEPIESAENEPIESAENEPIESAEQAWRIVKGYARRWQIETSFRSTKSELALESPRLWSWQRRLKLMMIVTLVYAFWSTRCCWGCYVCRASGSTKCYEEGVTAQESGTGKLRLRFTGCVLLLKLSSMSIHQTSWPTKVRDDSCFYGNRASFRAANRR